MRVACCVMSEPGAGDRARGALELLRAHAGELELTELIHVHGLSASEFADEYLADREVRLPSRSGEQGRCDRLNAAVEAACETDVDLGLFLDSSVWPMSGRPLHLLVRRVLMRGGLLGGMAMTAGALDAPPAGGLWPGLLVVDLAWQRARRMFPLDFATYARTVLARPDHWEVPTLAGCLSAGYFARIVSSVEPGQARRTALESLVRFEEGEPVLDRAGEQRRTLPALGLVTEPRPQDRVPAVRRYPDLPGPTLSRLRESGASDWFDTPHAHPQTR